MQHRAEGEEARRSTEARPKNRGPLRPRKGPRPQVSCGAPRNQGGAPRRSRRGAPRRGRRFCAEHQIKGDEVRSQKGAPRRGRRTEDRRGQGRDRAGAPLRPRNGTEKEHRQGLEPRNGAARGLEPTNKQQPTSNKKESEERKKERVRSANNDDGEAKQSKQKQTKHNPKQKRQPA
jgi:hypothetical protein